MTIRVFCVLALASGIIVRSQEYIYNGSFVNTTSEATSEALIEDPTVSCNESIYFKCSNESQSVLCIVKSAFCDGFWDCDDGSDEMWCHFEKCPKSQVLCQDKTACVPPLKICDGDYNCRDHSDEVGCSNQRECEESGKIPCDSNICIENNLRCDGVPDCSDGKDETNCSCNETQFQCESKQCIDIISRCDGNFDCIDKSDERSCYRIDVNGIAQNFRAGIWLPVCYNETTSNQTGNEICLSLGYSGSRNVSSLNITYLSTYSECENGLTLTCIDYNCDLKSIGLDQKTPQEINSTVFVGNYASNFTCRAQIISPVWLLSSFECLRSNFNLLDNLTAFVREEAVSVLTEIEEVVVHPHSSKFRSIYIRDYDFALLRLKRAISLNDTDLTPICLPSQRIDDGITCFAVEKSDIEPISYVLRDNSLCNSPTHFNDSVSDRHLCTEGNAICSSLGTPLICLASTSDWFLGGFLTYSHVSEYLRHPVIFSNIFNVRSFIDNTIGWKLRSVDFDSRIYEIRYQNESDFNDGIIEKNRTELFVNVTNTFLRDRNSSTDYVNPDLPNTPDYPDVYNNYTSKSTSIGVLYTTANSVNYSVAEYTATTDPQSNTDSDFPFESTTEAEIDYTRITNTEINSSTNESTTYIGIDDTATITSGNFTLIDSTLENATVYEELIVTSNQVTLTSQNVTIDSPLVSTVTNYSEDMETNHMNNKTITNPYLEFVNQTSLRVNEDIPTSNYTL